MLSVFGTIGMFLCGVGMIKYQDNKDKAESERRYQEFLRTDSELEFELWRNMWHDPKFKDFKFECERWHWIENELKKRNLILTWGSRRNVDSYKGKYDKNGLCEKNPKYKPE